MFKQKLSGEGKTKPIFVCDTKGFSLHNFVDLLSSDYIFKDRIDIISFFFQTLGKEGQRKNYTQTISEVCIVNSLDFSLSLLKVEASFFRMLEDREKEINVKEIKCRETLEKKMK